MTKKDYILIAECLKGYHGTNEAKTSRLVYRFISALKKDNPSFDENKFIEAIDK